LRTVEVGVAARRHVPLVVDVGLLRLGHSLDLRLVLRRELLRHFGAWDPRILRQVGIG
jgi:hypothetical protein